jgi:hypothetical protein
MGHTLRILNPVGELNFTPLSPAARLKDLSNKKIGLYWNHKARGNVALDRVKELLNEKFRGMSFEWFDTAVSAEAPQEWFENVKKRGVAGVVGATGD